MRVAFVSPLVVCVASLLLLASVAQAQICPAPLSGDADVTTWHDDNCRTGWQQNEMNLTATGSTAITQTNFGLVAQWNGTSANAMGNVYAQPLARSGLRNVQGQNGQTCTSPCSLILIADMNDNVFAYNAGSNLETPVWSVNLSQAIPGGGPVDCSSTLGSNFPPCEVPGVVLGGFVGVMGTPVIDTTTNILYAVGAVATTAVEFDLFAVNILNGAVLGLIPIVGSVSPGEDPGLSQICTSTYPATGDTRTFDSGHIQRSALLFLSPNVYVAFSPSDQEWENGWIFAYSFATPNFTQNAELNSTPYGTGGGIWGSGAGPASDGTAVYTVTGNGTYDVNGLIPATRDFSDSVLKLNATNFSVLDYYTPSDVFNYVPPQGSSQKGRCYNDTDLSSGGLMILPDDFYNSLSLAVNADKESNIYVLNINNLGRYVASGGSNFEGNYVETITTPPVPQNDPVQGYWASPAYWRYIDSNQQTHYLLYYAATTKDNLVGVPPLAIYQYALQTSGSSGPISTSYAEPTTTLFCQYSPTPSISSNGTTTGSGILWGIEHRNSDNPGNPADCAGSGEGSALHAFNATNMSVLYNSSLSLSRNLVPPTQFSTPTVFLGRVYMGTSSQVYVFGLCSTGPSRQCVQPQ
jgi:hypothetical protein